MKFDLLIQLSLVYVAITNVFSQKCEVKQCATKDTVFTDQQCIKYRKDQTSQAEYYEIDHKQCNSTISYCPPVFDSTSEMKCATKQADPYSGIEGAACERDAECFSEVCNKDTAKCTGVPVGKYCKNTRDCTIGTFCKDHNICTKQYPFKGNCTGDLECANNLGCLSGTCLNLYSLEDGAKVDQSDYRFCKSNTVRDGQCVTTELLSNDECSETQTFCNYTYTVSGQAKVDYTKPCKCSSSDPDKKYCSYGSKSKPWKDDLIPSLKNWYTNDAIKQHAMKKDLYSNDLKWKIYQIQQYPIYKNADDCLKKFYASSSFIFVKYGLLFLLAMIFV